MMMPFAYITPSAPCVKVGFLFLLSALSNEGMTVVFARFALDQ